MVMMNVQRMRSIVDVIVTGEMPPAAQDAAERWQAVSLVHVRSSANHVFRLTLPDGNTGYLRLTPAAERSQAALGAEVEFIQHVARAGVPVAQPLPSQAGSFIEEIDVASNDRNARRDSQRYHALVFACLPGRQLDHDELDEPHFRTWGRVLAQLHEASRTFPFHQARPSLMDEIRQARASLPAGEDKVEHVLEASAEWLETLPTQPDGYGLLHGDCEIDNLVWDGLKPQLLDFDGAIYGPNMMDVAIALQEIWLAEDSQREDHVNWFCDGYRDVRPLPFSGLESLPRLITLMTAIKVAQLVRAYADTTDDDGETGANPPWLVNMKTRHQTWLHAQRTRLVWR